MAKNIINMTTINKVIKEYTPDVKEIQLTQDVIVKITPTISLEKYGNMISDITAMTLHINKSVGNGFYAAHYNTFATEFNLVKYFTNINTSNEEKIFQLVHCSDLISDIINNINIPINTIKNDVEKSIEFTKNLVFKSSPWDSVATRIGDLLENLDNVTTLFNGVDQETIINGMKALGNINEEKIINLARQTDVNGKSRVK